METAVLGVILDSSVTIEAERQRLGAAQMNRHGNEARPWKDCGYHPTARPL